MMKDFFRKRPLLGFFIVASSAAVVASWLTNPTTGPWALVSGGMTWATAITLFVVFLIFIAGAALTYVALRLAGDPIGFGLVPVGQGYTPGRRLNVISAVATIRSADDVLDELDQMMVMARGVEPALPQMNQQAARLNFTRASDVLRLDGDAGERIAADDDDVRVENGRVLERERVERTAELVRGHDERRREAVVPPRADERGACV